MLILSYPRISIDMDGTLNRRIKTLCKDLRHVIRYACHPLLVTVGTQLGVPHPHKDILKNENQWSVPSISPVVLVLSYLCHIVHSIVHVRPRFCSYKRSRDYLSCSFSLIDNLPWFLLSPHYIYLNSKTLATIYLWYF